MVTRYQVHSYQSFVRDTVKSSPLTDQIIHAIMPYFPLSCRVIGGFLNASDQFWKVNYHWELLSRQIDRALAMDLPARHQACAKAIKDVLSTNPPQPARGYCASRQLGQPEDHSSREVITKRWITLRQCKRDMRRIIDAAEILKKDPERRRVWYLAVAPVARPGRSKHSTGYAVDILGDNKLIRETTAALGATLVFDEKSHVHVEFANGVTGAAPAAAVAAPRAAASSGAPLASSETLSRAELAELACGVRRAPLEPEFEEAADNPTVLMGLFDDLSAFLHDPVDWVESRFRDEQ